MTDSPLDSMDTYARQDPSGLYGRIAELPEQMRKAWDAARALSLPPGYSSAERVVVLGMGGSGIGGALLRALAIESGAKTPFEIVRGCRVPAQVNARSLVIASSNSGNTEETTAAFAEAMASGARCVAITTGGRLREMAREHGVPALTFAWDGEPRSALGWSFASLLAICGRLGLVPDVAAEFDAALAHMRSVAVAVARDVPEASNPAKRMARRWLGNVPVIIGAEALAPVAYRWRTQVNENGKSWAIADELSEFNHNAPVGYALPSALAPLLRATFLRQASVHARIGLRIDLSIEQMRAAGIDADVLDIPGETALSQMLWAVQFGDFASYYLGILNGADPSEVRALDWLKAKLGQSSQ
jgi:glucose/mannose-6-phosphate isomerase